MEEGWVWDLPKMPNTPEDAHFRKWAPSAPEGTFGETEDDLKSDLADKNPLEAGFSADPFASLKDDSRKLKVEPTGGDYPHLPEFLDRRTAQGS
jgi:hypothetical protein